jgi:hypothetical protein
MDSAEQKAAEISQRIAQLEGILPENLKGEMVELKKALLENPAACLLLKDEDIGALVTHLRKLTNTAIISASTNKTSSTAKKEKALKPMSATDLAKALNEVDDF